VSGGGVGEGDGRADVKMRLLAGEDEGTRAEAEEGAPPPPPPRGAPLSSPPPRRASLPPLHRAVLLRRPTA
jgi:hypothetical protein